MPNIQVIDDAGNCTYDVFEIEQDGFDLIFPSKGQDVEFIEDFFERVGDQRAIAVMTPVWKRRLKKPEVRGIHGTLFYGLESKKEFYPTKRESEMVTGLELK